MRVVPPWIILDAAIRFDNLIDNFIASKILIPKEEWTEVHKILRSLPISHGGLGLARSADIAPIAFSSSLESSLHSGDEILWSWARNNGDVLLPRYLNLIQVYDQTLAFNFDNQATRVDLTQKEISYKFVHEPNKELILNSITLDGPQNAWFKSSCFKGCPWLTGAVGSCGNVLSPIDYVINVRMMFLLLIVQDVKNVMDANSFICSCKPDHPVDLALSDQRYHPLSCKGNQSVLITNRHDCIANTLLSFIRKVIRSAIPDYIGATGATGTGHNRRGELRKCDVVANIGDELRAFDVMIVSTGSPTYVKVVAWKSGENTKRRQYSTQPDFNMASLVPVVIETTGHFGGATLLFLKWFKDAAISLGVDEDLFLAEKRNFCSKISHIIATTNALCYKNWLSSHNFLA